MAIVFEPVQEECLQETALTRRNSFEPRMPVHSWFSLCICPLKACLTEGIESLDCQPCSGQSDQS